MRVGLILQQATS